MQGLEELVVETRTATINSLIAEKNRNIIGYCFYEEQLLGEKVETLQF